jgi:hypothetical protein
VEKPNPEVPKRKAAAVVDQSQAAAHLEALEMRESYSLLTTLMRLL